MLSQFVVYSLVMLPLLIGSVKIGFHDTTPSLHLVAIKNKALRVAVFKKRHLRKLQQNIINMHEKSNELLASYIWKYNDLSEDDKYLIESILSMLLD